MYSRKDCYQQSAPLKPFYGMHGPKGLSQITPLRFGLRNLNHHKFIQFLEIPQIQWIQQMMALAIRNTFWCSALALMLTDGACSLEVRGQVIFGHLGTDPFLHFSLSSAIFTQLTASSFTYTFIYILQPISPRSSLIVPPSTLPCITLCATVPSLHAIMSKPFPSSFLLFLCRAAAPISQYSPYPFHHRWRVGEVVTPVNP